MSVLRKLAQTTYFYYFSPKPQKWQFLQRKTPHLLWSILTLLSRGTGLVKLPSFQPLFLTYFSPFWVCFRYSVPIYNSTIPWWNTARCPLLLPGGGSQEQTTTTSPIIDFHGIFYTTPETAGRPISGLPRLMCTLLLTNVFRNFKPASNKFYMKKTPVIYRLKWTYYSHVLSKTLAE